MGDISATSDLAYTSVWADLRGVSFTQGRLAVHRPQVVEKMVLNTVGGWTAHPEVMARIMCLREMDIRRANMISEAQYRAIKTPTLVVWTSHDPTATPAEGAEIADMIEGSHFIVMNQCGHWPQYEDAALFNRVHINFLLGRDITQIPGVRA